MTVNRIAFSVLVAMLVTSPAWAMSDDAPQKNKAKEQKEKSVEREADLYDEGTDALDEKDWTRAERIFRRVARMQGEHADASLYWLSRAQNEMGQRAEALATLLELQKAAPK